MWQIKSKNSKSSMGPRSLDRGNDGTPTPGAIRAQSSMGPRSLDRGNHGAVVCSKTTIRASMGPRSLDRGNRWSGGATASTPPLFNGAAISRSRKSSSRKQKGKKEFSSMGPRSLDRGNEAVKAIAKEMLVFNGAAISRSRKWFRPAQAIRAAGSLQWGRDLSIAEIEPVAHSKRARPAGLQWGRDLSIAEICRVTKARESGRLSSMGPRSLDRGNSTSASAALPGVSASSMGPRSLDRGNPPACRLGIKFQVLFNGAAISRSRKWFDSTFHVREDIILQWGRDLSIAEICGFGCGGPG